MHNHNQNPYQLMEGEELMKRAKKRISFETNIKLKEVTSQ
jgi:hypothetical protein